MTDRIAEIRARLDAATPWPWEVGQDLLFSTARAVYEAGDVNPLAECMDPHDADLIAHAPADIAWLLAEVERLRGPRQHLDGCAAVEAALCMQEARCTCGLDGNDA